MGPREFDPVALGNAECDAWVAYYRREWRVVLTSAVRLVRLGFGMSWPRTAARVRGWCCAPTRRGRRTRTTTPSGRGG